MTCDATISQGYPAEVIEGEGVNRILILCFSYNNNNFTVCRIECIIIIVIIRSYIYNYCYQLNKLYSCLISGGSTVSIEPPFQIRSKKSRGTRL